MSGYGYAVDAQRALGGPGMGGLNIDLAKIPAPSPLRTQLALIADNLLIMLDQVTRVEDAVSYAPAQTQNKDAGKPITNSIQELVGIINDRTLAVTNRLGNVADKL